MYDYVGADKIATTDIGKVDLYPSQQDIQTYKHTKRVHIFIKV